MQLKQMYMDQILSSRPGFPQCRAWNAQSDPVNLNLTAVSGNVKGEKQSTPFHGYNDQLKQVQAETFTVGSV